MYDEFEMVAVYPRLGDVAHLRCGRVSYEVNVLPAAVCFRTRLLIVVADVVHRSAEMPLILSSR